MKDKFEQALSVLVGLPIWASGRALDLQIFHFGNRQTVVTRQGGTKDVGEYVLHIQCAWRLSGPDRIVVASRDRYYPPDSHEDVPDDFRWDAHGNRYDVRIESFLLEHATEPLVVTSIEVDRSGGFKLFLTQAYALEVFPDDSFDDEHSEYWRLFQPATNADHFVVAGNGLMG